MLRERTDVGDEGAKKGAVGEVGEMGGATEWADVVGGVVPKREDRGEDGAEVKAEDTGEVGTFSTTLCCQRSGIVGEGGRMAASRSFRVNKLGSEVLLNRVITFPSLPFVVAGGEISKKDL